MRSIILLLAFALVLLLTISSCVARDMIVGTSYNARLAYQQKTEYMGIPFKKRVKEVFWSDPGQQIIKVKWNGNTLAFTISKKDFGVEGVIVRDIDRSEGSAIITAGGVGFSYVNIRFKSERGSALNYQSEIYGIKNSNSSTIQLNDTMFITASIERHIHHNGSDKIALHERIKRQSSSGAGKFMDAAKMPQIKVLRMFLQLFSNLWSDSSVGGSGPFNPENVKPVIYLFKDKIVAFFLPKPGEEHPPKSH